MLRVAFFSFVVASVVGCFASAPETRPEGSDDPDNQCPSGQVCINFVCERVCDSVDDCEAHEACIRDICVAYAQSCANGETCAEGWYCDGAACRRDQTLGNACGDETECERGHCVDGVCCNDACAGECMGCTEELTGDVTGRCAPIPEGDDPETECGTHRGCDGAGACLPVDPIGAPCVEDETCASEHCSPDGVCCDMACDGVCESCLIIYTGMINGLCAAIPEGGEVASECLGNTCSGLRSCKSSVGGACTDEAECVSGYCANGTCEAAPTITVPDLFYPWNGYATGTYLVAANRQPRFRWNASEGGVGQLTYELWLEDDCVLSDFRNCGFDTPVIFETDSTDFTVPTPLDVEVNPPVGERYFFKVRAVDDLGTESPWSEVRYIDVGRERKDLNGDGYADLAVGAPGHTVYVSGTTIDWYGGVFVYFGSETGLPDSPSLTIRNVDDWAHHNSFGIAVAIVGDVSGDGFSDLAVGVSGYMQGTTSSGGVVVYYGGIAGPSGLRTVIDSPVNQTGAKFGGALSAVGDTNADGYADLLVGSYWLDDSVDQEGRAYLYEGRFGAIGVSPATTIESPMPHAGGEFGHWQAGGGDLDGDGFTDALIGGIAPHPQDGEDSLQYYVYFGRRVGLAPTHDQRLARSWSSTDTRGLSGTLAIGELDGDGYADVAVGVINLDSTEQGSVLIYQGDPQRLLASSQPETIEAPAGAGYGFGLRVAVGRRAGAAVLGVSDPTYEVGEDSIGRFHTFHRQGDFLVEMGHLENPLAEHISAFGIVMAGVGSVDGTADESFALGFRDPHSDDYPVYVVKSADGELTELTELVDETHENPNYAADFGRSFD